MGAPDGIGNENEHPQRMVEVPAFEMMKHEITVNQYRACVDAGACNEPRCDVNTDEFLFSEPCNYAYGRDDHPVNFVTWRDLRIFGAWVGADLPTEAQWEFAARGGGRDQLYPWGDDRLNCDQIATAGPESIGLCPHSTSGVCMFPESHSSQGVCDLSGNVFEFVLDEYAENYGIQPSDGSAFCSAEDCSGDVNRIVRGGSWFHEGNDWDGKNFLRATFRMSQATFTNDSQLGGRLARPLKRKKQNIFEKIRGQTGCKMNPLPSDSVGHELICRRSSSRDKLMLTGRSRTSRALRRCRPCPRRRRRRRPRCTA